MIHPHDDEPELPIWETIIFHKCFLLFVLDLQDEEMTRRSTIIFQETSK